MGYRVWRVAARGNLRDSGFLSRWLGICLESASRRSVFGTKGKLQLSVTVDDQ